MPLRFAPSPSGYLHVGNARTAVMNWILSKQSEESFLLRLDDTDEEKSKEKYAQSIREDLDWLGLSWNNSITQSSRLNYYNDVFEKLKKNKQIYPCYETDEELNLKRALKRNSGLPPVYDRSALNLTSKDIRQLESEGRKPYWRFKLPEDSFSWEDEIHGKIKFDVSSYSDPVLMRADGRPLYSLTSVADDIDMNISFIVRGNDHLSNSGAQVAIFKSLGADIPKFAHLGLLVGSRGDPLSKRTGSLSLKSLRENGIEAQALLNYLIFVGTSSAINLNKNEKEIVERFDLANLSKNNAHFDESILNSLTSQYLHILSFEEVKDRFNNIGISTVKEEFWDVIRKNISIFEDVLFWWKVVNDNIQTIINDKEFIGQAMNCMPVGEFTNNTWKEWTNNLSAMTGKKGKSLFMPLRLAITGCDYGPAMGDLLPLIGRQKVCDRLNQ